ncbi:hypothetical protein GDO78_008215 [Eleutherodactylus coqui]|uniref:Uncharacterized protein n=1 Tax=Eleutherodactylus coqui TaxID=57060 RepID=A0A8J6FDF9_ELECQ|nr:hypothetical protein GDO78_008215 [Eleutherodactylus coqui]
MLAVGTKCFKRSFFCISPSGLLFRLINFCSFVALLSLPVVKTWHGGKKNCTKMGSRQLCRHGFLLLSI